MSMRGTRDYNISLIFLFYWVVLIAWQSLNPNAVGSASDTLIKIILLVMMLSYFLLYARLNLQPIVLLLFFLLNMSLSFTSDGVVSLRTLLNYYYPVLFAFLVFIVGGKNELQKSRFKAFLNGVVIVVFYMAAYAVLFMRQEMIIALRASSAYGNEFSSFFISNHEYALYLMAGVISAILLLEFSHSRSFLLKLWYVGCIGVFLLNLVLTFSRTYLFATLAIIMVYVIIHRKSKVSRVIMLVGIAAVICVLTVPMLRQYAFEVVLKENTDAGRGELLSLAWNTYKEGSVFQKLWGQGFSNMQQYFDAQTSHRSVHNAYMQILLYYGVIALVFVLVYIFVHLRAIAGMIKYNRSLGAVFVALPIGALLAMMAQTVTIFTSYLDSYFLTVFAFIVPKYVMNSIRSGTFEDGEAIQNGLRDAETTTRG